MVGMLKALALAATTLLLAACASPGHAPPSGGGVGAGFDGWQEFKLPGKRPTQYRVVHIDGQAAMEATSASAASMLRRPAQVAPAELGDIAFDWKADRLIENADLSQADRSDSPVRVVLAFGGDNARLSMKNRMAFELMETLVGEPPPFATLMYVWDNQAPVETVLTDPRSDRIRKIVVESGAAELGHWRQHRRDIAADFRRAYGEEPGALIGVALFTDTDNTRGSAHSYYRPVVLRDAAGKVR